MSNFRKKQIKRMKMYKCTLSRESSVEKRRQLIVNLSKNKSESNLEKRRRIMDQTNMNLESGSNKGKLAFPRKTVSSYQQMFDIITEKDPDYKMKMGSILKKIRYMISSPNYSDLVIDMVTDQKLLISLFKLLEPNKSAIYQLDALLILSNILSQYKNKINALIEYGLIPFLAYPLQNKTQENLIFYTLICVGLIAGSNEKNRNKIIDSDLPKFIIKIVENTKDLRLIRQSSWVFSVLFDQIPLPSFEKLEAMVELFFDLINFEDEEVIIDISKAISKIAFNPQNIGLILDSNILPTIVSHLSSGINRIILPSLKIIGNMLLGTNEQDNLIINTKLLETLKELLTSENMLIRKDTCWIISNILTQKQHLILVQDHGIFEILYEILQNDHLSVKKESLYCFCNIITLGDPIFVENILATNKIFEIFASFLEHNDTQIILKSLNLFKNIILISEHIALIESLSENTILKKLEEYQIIQKIEKLFEHTNKEISLLSKHALEIIHYINSENDIITRNEQTYRLFEYNQEKILKNKN
ncbi:importin subunit alpha [Anaeramoeba flamelloides]|uniref:Importin subunit alpha n=1 Tax=Anaeramoeba flamelloides TaxID=1746091 RepID=A0ABQ8YR15_9EUKA|nr:importin subunit alpha [Anaeramoeba flamelloides]